MVFAAIRYLSENPITMDPITFLPPILFSVAIGISLEVLRPGEKKNEQINPTLAAIIWLIAFIVTAFVISRGLR